MAIVNQTTKKIYAPSKMFLVDSIINYGDQKLATKSLSVVNCGNQKLVTKFFLSPNSMIGN